MTEIGANPPRLPKRFYKEVAAVAEGDGFVVRLDGKVAKTRAGRPLVLASRPLAEAVAEEWRAQGAHVDFSAMPMTRYKMTALDLGDADRERWRDNILSFLSSDLLCYRAIEPAALVERQARSWDPLLDWAANALGTRLNVGAGISFIEQPPEAADAAQRLLDMESSQRLLAAKTAAELSGSAIIAFCLLKGAAPVAQLFAAARVDEDFQAERWGLDQEAAQRARRLEKDFADAARFLLLV